MSMRLFSIIFACGTLGLCAGCLFTSKSSLNDSQTQNRIFSQQSRAQLSEIENLKAHSRNLEDKLINSETEIAALKQQSDFSRRQLAEYERQNAETSQKSQSLARNRYGSTSDINSSSQSSSSDGRTVR